jgi:acyl-CoA thioesterase I
LTPPLAFLRRALAAAALLFLAAPAFAAGTVMVFGDSLSAAYGLAAREGWVSLLAERLEKGSPPWQVANASVSGETTAGGLSRIPAELERHRPSIVLIELGANDALRGQPMAAIRANLERMIALVRRSRAQPVLVGLMIPPNYGIDYAREFRELYPDIARKAQVPLVPFLLAGVVEHDDLFQADRLHPTASAQPRILENVWGTLQPLVRKRRP